MQYPLLFPYGEPGWHPDLKNALGGKLILSDFAQFRLQQRDREGIVLLAGDRSLQEFVVDLWGPVEQQRLLWVSTHQDQLRVEVYQDAYFAGASP